MKDLYKRLAKINIFPILSMLMAAYFFYAFSVAVGVPPVPALDWQSAGYLLLAVIFFLAPEIQRFELAKLHDYEGRLEDAKGEILLLKSQLRTLISAYNELLAARGKTEQLSRPMNTAARTVELPGPEDADTARQQLDSALGEEADQTQLDAEIEHFLNEEDFDIESALWDMRKVLDRELRRVAGSETLSGNGSSRMATSQAVFEEFSRRYSEYPGLRPAFVYVLKVCDASVHGREVPAACALEAFQMGFRMLGALRKISPTEDAKQVAEAPKQVAPVEVTKQVA